MGTTPPSSAGLRAEQRNLSSKRPGDGGGDWTHPRRLETAITSMLLTGAPESTWHDRQHGHGHSPGTSPEKCDWLSFVLRQRQTQRTTRTHRSTAVNHRSGRGEGGYNMQPHTPKHMHMRWANLHSAGALLGLGGSTRHFWQHCLKKVFLNCSGCTDGCLQAECPNP